MDRKITKLLCFCLLLLGQQAFAQVTGTKTIPVDYPNLAAAITDLNAVGVSGNVVINVPASHTETAPAGGFKLGSAILNSSLSASSTLTIQKSGNGANPLLTAPVGTSTTADGIFFLQGTDYVTIDGIDLTESAANTTTTTQATWGYALVKLQNTLPYDGCHFVTIRNCTIDMGLTVTTSTAIQVGNHIATATTALSGTAASQSDAHSHNSFYGNTIVKANRGIYMIGMATEAVYDVNNSVGVTTPNVINIGNTSSTGYGVYAANDSILTVSNNYFTFSNTLTTGASYCVYQATGTGSVTVSNNSFDLSRTGTSGGAYGFYNNDGSDLNATLEVNNNTFIATYPTATTAVVYCFYNNGNAYGTVNVVNNTIDGINMGTGAFYGLYNSASTTANINCTGNVVKNVTKGVGTSTSYAIYNTASGTAGTISVTNNLVSNMGTMYSLYGVYAGGGANQTVLNKFNKVENITGATSSIYGFYGATAGNNSEVAFDTLQNVQMTTGTLYGLYTSMGASSSVHDCIVTNFTNTTGTAYCMYSSGGTPTFANNIVTNITKTGASGVLYGMYFSSATNATAYNNHIADFNVPANFSLAQAAYGIYCSAATSYSLYHNTIKIAFATTGTNLGATGIYYSSSTSASLDLRNNIINVDVIPSGTGYTAALRRSGGTAGTPPVNLDMGTTGNIYYVPSATNAFIYAEGTAVASLVNTFNLANDPSFNTGCGLYKAFMVPREFSSFTENNLSVPGGGGGGLPIYRPSGSSFAESVGVTTSATTDLFGTPRTATPDAGAVEFSGTVQDAAAPSILYTEFPATSYCLTPPSLVATITDASGVNTTPGTAPRVYYKKASENNVFGTYPGDNTSAFNGWKYVEATNSGSTFTFNIDYSKLTSAVAVGDSITYFVVAQDVSAATNVATNVAGYPAGYCPSSVNLSVNAGPIAASPVANGYMILAVPTFAASASPSALCQSGTAVLSVGPLPVGAEIQWQEDNGTNVFTDISGATNATYTTPVLTTSGNEAEFRFRAQIKCNGTVVATSDPDTVTVYNPQILTTTPDSRCGSGTLTLGATASPGAQISWYTAATGGTAIATGTSFTTPVLGTTTTYYAAANNGGSTVYGGRPAPVSTATGYSAGTAAYGQVFDATQSFVLTSVDVFSSAAAGSMTLVIADNNGTIVHTVGPIAIPAGTGTTIATGATPTTIPLNLPINPGTGYRMYVTNLTATLLRENGGLTYPYPLGTVGNVTTSWTSGSPSTANYYFFYNWQVTTGCEPTRLPVVATVSPSPGTVSASASQDTVCQGSSTTLTASSSYGGWTSFSWTPGNLTGASVSVSPATATRYYVTAADASNCTAVDSVDIEVVNTPVAVATIDAQDQLCLTGTASLSLNPLPAFGIDYQWQRNTGSGFVDIAGATNTTFSETITSTTSYQAKMICNGTVVSTSTPVTVTVNNPTVTNVFPGERCGAGPVTLAATASTGATINWYAAATGGTPLATGNAFTTPSIAATTQYFAAAVLGGSTAQLGLANRVSTTTNNGYSDVGLMFDALVPFTLQSVAMYPVGSGTGTVAATIQLKNSTGTVLDAITVNIPTSASPGVKTTVPLNFAVPAGTGHRLVLSGATGGGISGFIREITSGFSYPYTVTGVASITSAYTSGASSSYYYYFYDWQIATGCESPRTPVTATINGAPSGSGLATGGTTTGTIHADGTTVSYTDACNDLVATVTDAPGGNTLGTTSAIVLSTSTVQTFNGAPYVPRVFDINPASDGPATVTLYALQSDFTAYNTFVTTNSLGLPLLPTGPSDAAGIANIVLTQYHGSAFDGTTGPNGLYDASQKEFIPNTSITASSNGTYWTITFPVSGFSGFFIHTGNGPLVIDLAKISATNFGDRNRVDWSTHSEVSGDKFELERSADGRNFSYLATVTAKGQPSTYSYWDEKPFSGVNHYRLKMKNAAGQSSYSAVVTATVKGQGLFSVEAFPNPVSDKLTVKVNGITAANAEVTILDVTGKLISTVKVLNNEATVEMSGLAQGAYIVKYTDANNTQTIKVNKQ